MMFSSKIDPSIKDLDHDINLASYLAGHPKKIEFVNDSFLMQFDKTIQNYHIDFPADERRPLEE